MIGRRSRNGESGHDGDQTWRLLRQGYRWAPGLRGQAAAVRTRLLGRRAVLIGGPAGVRRFYDASLRRQGAVPAVISRVLFGRGTVHGLDDAAHHERKSLFVGLLTAPAVDDLCHRAENAWSTTDTSGERSLFDAAVQVQAAAVMGWAGISVSVRERRLRARQLAQVVDGFATPVRPYLRAVLSRWRTDRWVRRLIKDARRQPDQARPDTPLQRVATFTDSRGHRLPVAVAGTELHNLVRPTIAVAWFIQAAGTALAERPHWRRRIADGDRQASRAFAEEVRRLYPFVPVLVAKARQQQDVLGVPVRPGGLVILDVHGTTHDPDVWTEPDSFDPERHLRGIPEPDALIPQGGGDVASGHRCPGEEVVLGTLEVAIVHLARHPELLPPPSAGLLHQGALRRVPPRTRAAQHKRVAQARPVKPSRRGPAR